MTEMVDEVIVVIRMYPDRAEVRYNTDINKLRDWARTMLGNLGPLCVRGEKGKLDIYGGGIVLEYSHTGLMEIPEETGSDN